jgi:mono/diheme cytochrome c family protein
VNDSGAAEAVLKANIMVNQDSTGKAPPVLAIASGVALGVMVFAGLNLWFGRPFIPTVEDLPTYPNPERPELTALALAASRPAGPTDPGEAAFQTVCAACHQMDGKGLAGTFPPLAGSHWVNDDAETPIRIVLAGISGPIEVEGAKYASIMPPPPNMDDAKIAAVLTYVRKSFGNKGSEVTKDQVAAVRASLAGRTTPWTAEELTALRPAAGGAAAPGGGAAAPTPAPTTAPTP